MPRIRRAARRVGSLMVTTALALGFALSATAGAAQAAPKTPDFGSDIDAYASLDPQTTCKSEAQPGVLGFRALLNSTYGGHTGYIMRACDDGGTSEHKEGRALDYMLSVNDSADNAVANDVLTWLLATDKYGNKHANARRLGIMYIIWNHKIWGSYKASEGWRDYSGSNPHTDHIHFSFSWDGALKRTSWWTYTPVPPTPHGPTWGRDRSVSAVWDVNAKQTDTNPATTAIAGSALPDGTVHQQVLIPGSGVWDRGRNASGGWDGSAQHVDTNPASTDVASAVLPDGTMHLQVLVPGSGVWDRARHPDGSWDATARHIDTNPATTAISSVVTSDGTLYVQMLIPGSGLWSRSRSVDGSWAATSTHVDTNPASTDTTAAALPDGSLHYFVLVPGSGVWDRVRHPDGTLDENATHVDTNPRSIALSSAGLSNGTIDLAVTVPDSGVWVRDRSAGGAWAPTATHIDTNGTIFDTYTVALPNGTLHIGDAVNIA